MNLSPGLYGCIFGSKCKGGLWLKTVVFAIRANSCELWPFNLLFMLDSLEFNLNFGTDLKCVHKKEGGYEIVECSTNVCTIADSK